MWKSWFVLTHTVVVHDVPQSSFGRTHESSAMGLHDLEATEWLATAKPNRAA
jgi:hypothetical protein